MRANLARGIACLVAGAVAIALVELAWDAGHAQGASSPGQAAVAEDAGAAAAAEGADGSSGVSRMMAWVLEGDEGAYGEGLPAGFGEECLDPSGLGEALCSANEGVVGIVSEMEGASLFAECASRLEGRGWVRLASGQPTRAAFAKAAGAHRWLFLDVGPTGSGSIAVFSFEGAWR